MARLLGRSFGRFRNDLPGADRVENIGLSKTERRFTTWLSMSSWRGGGRFNARIEQGGLARCESALIFQWNARMMLDDMATKASEPTLILTNDDGWDAPGLAALQLASATLGLCHVVAPSGPISGCGHRVTTDLPLIVNRPRDGFVSVSGTPADCVRLAIHHLAPGPSWVLAGINAGGNLGMDIHYSGTVAAVREAVIHGVPGIALSHYIARGRAIDWDRAGRWATTILARLMAQEWEPGTFWNVNLPHLEPGQPDPDIVFCSVDPSPLPLRYRVEGDRSTYTGDYQSRGRRPGFDVDVCFSGRIAVTLVRIAGDLPGVVPR
jgi:5'-nucleotidase